MKRYKVIGVKVETGEGDEKQVSYDPIVDQNGTKWAPGSEVSEKQVPNAADLIARKEIEELPGNYDDNTGAKIDE